MITMNAFTFPAFRKNGQAVQLAEVLAVLPDNNLMWSILEFNGMGEAPDNLSMDEFEEMISRRSGGLMMSWNDLKQIAVRFQQTIDCIIVGAESAQNILNTHKESDDFSSCEVVLTVFDSTAWSVWARDPDLMEKLTTIY